MADTTTYAPQPADPTDEQAPDGVQRRHEWPANPPYQNDVPQWPPVQPPAPPIGQPGATGGAAPHRRPRQMVVAALIAAVVVGGGVAGGVIGSQLDHGSAGNAGSPTAAATATAAAARNGNLADVVAKVSPSIVTVKVNTGQGTAVGSGIVLTADGRIVTNSHVVAAGGSGDVKVTLANGRTVPATVVGTDASADIAVLQAQGVSGLTPATLGDSSTLKVGDTVLAFGSPLDLEGTVTSGIVSALNRKLNSREETLSGLVQTDAAINPGNSGGALVDTAGRVVGINVAIATTGQDTGNIGVGFAIPINTAKSVVDQIVNR